MPKWQVHQPGEGGFVPSRFTAYRVQPLYRDSCFEGSTRTQALLSSKKGVNHAAPWYSWKRIVQPSFRPDDGGFRTARGVEEPTLPHRIKTSTSSAASIRSSGIRSVKSTSSQETHIHHPKSSLSLSLSPTQVPRSTAVLDTTTISQAAI